MEKSFQTVIKFFICNNFYENLVMYSKEIRQIT